MVNKNSSSFAIR